MTSFTPHGIDYAAKTMRDPDPPPKRDSMFAQLDAWKRKGWHVELREANGNGWICLIDSVGLMNEPNYERGGEVIRIKAVSSIQPTPEAAIADLLTAVQP